MEKRDHLPNYDGTEYENQAENMPFLHDITPDLLEAVYSGLDAEQKPMAFVSDDLLVLRQTHACDNLLECGAFYSVESVLPPMLCVQLRQCIQMGERARLHVQLMQQQWTIQVIPVQAGALLVFEGEGHRQAGVTIATAHLRVSASHLLMRAHALDDAGRTEEAADLRCEALRILRQAGHMEVLFGASEPVKRELLVVGEVLETMRQRLAARGVTVETQTDVPDCYIATDEQLLQSALTALVSNSLRYGGEQVHIRLTASRNESGVVFGVDDDGPGLSERVMAHMNDSWMKADALPDGCWGLGIPYVRGIASRLGGMLVFPHGESGCRARLFLPDSTDDIDLFETESSYHVGSSGPHPIDIELSDAVEAVVFRAR